MRPYLTLSLLSAALAASAPAAFAGPRVTDAAGGFSYTAPAGWQVGSLPMSKYKLAYIKIPGGFAPNINVVDESAALSLDSYARAATAQLKARMPGFRLAGQSPFVTRAGLHGIKVVTQAAPIGRTLRQTYYLFAARGTRKLVVTASAPAAAGTKYDAAFDAAMKTFTIQ